MVCSLDNPIAVHDIIAIKILPFFMWISFQTFTEVLSKWFQCCCFCHSTLTSVTMYIVVIYIYICTTSTVKFSHLDYSYLCIGYFFKYLFGSVLIYCMFSVFPGLDVSTCSLMCSLFLSCVSFGFCFKTSLHIIQI